MSVGAVMDPGALESHVHGVVCMQLGIVNDQAAARARAAGLKVVMNTCIATTHDALRARGQI